MDLLIYIYIYIYLSIYMSIIYISIVWPSYTDLKE